MAYTVTQNGSGPGFGQRELVGWPARMHGFGQVVMPFSVIDGFAFDKSDLDPAQQTKIIAVARHILAQGIRGVRLVGHTDPVGTSAYNSGLGQRRADAVRRALLATLERMRPGSAASVAVTVVSVGATQTIPGQAAARNRRVEVFLQIPQPSPTPTPPPQQPTPTPLPPVRPYQGPTMGPAPANAPRGPECPDDYVCWPTRNFLIERRRATGTITAADVARALDLEHQLLRRHRQAPAVVDPHQAEHYWKWVSEMRQEACKRLKKFAETNWMPFPRC